MLQLRLLNLLLVCVGAGALDDGPVRAGKRGNGRNQGGSADESKKDAFHFQLQMGGTRPMR